MRGLFRQVFRPDLAAQDALFGRSGVFLCLQEVFIAHIGLGIAGFHANREAPYVIALGVEAGRALRRVFRRDDRFAAGRGDEFDLAHALAVRGRIGEMDRQIVTGRGFLAHGADELDVAVDGRFSFFPHESPGRRGFRITVEGIGAVRPFTQHLAGDEEGRDAETDVALLAVDEDIVHVAF